MDRNVKLIPLRPDDKTDLLRKLQGGSHFEKILTASNVYRNRRSEMVVPAWFVAEHGDKILKSVLLRPPSSSKSWTVRLSISIQYGCVKMVGGWPAFVTVNGLSKGDTLIFSLKDVSEFEVYLFRTNPQEFPSRERFNDSKAKKAKQSHEQLAAYGNIQPNRLMKKKTAVGEKRSDPAYDHSSTSCSLTSRSSDLHLLSESENSRDASSEDCRGLHSGNKSAIDHHKLSDKMSGVHSKDSPVQHSDARMKKENVEYQAAPLETETRNRKRVPRFFKKLTTSNIRHLEGGGSAPFMEIPAKFWKEHSSHFHSVVQLQGIREESKVRTVACRLHFHPRQTRLHLQAGWKKFACENKLEVGQELFFTLTGDSFFVVREVL